MVAANAGSKDAEIAELRLALKDLHEQHVTQEQRISQLMTDNGRLAAANADMKRECEAVKADSDVVKKRERESAQVLLCY